MCHPPVAVCLAALVLLAAPAAAQRSTGPLGTPTLADLDGDGVSESVRLRETTCVRADGGETDPPCAAGTSRRIQVEVADTCRGREEVLTVSREMEVLTLAQVVDANGDGFARELVFEARAGAAGRVIQARVISFRAGAYGCVAVRKTLFSYPQAETVGRAPRGTTSRPGLMELGDFSRHHAGLELRTTDGYGKPSDPACCPRFVRTTYWRYDPPRGTYRTFRTKLRRRSP